MFQNFFVLFREKFQGIQQTHWGTTGKMQLKCSRFFAFFRKILLIVLKVLVWTFLGWQIIVTEWLSIRKVQNRPQGLFQKMNKKSVSQKPIYLTLFSFKPFSHQQLNFTTFSQVFFISNCETIITTKTVLS